MDSTHIHGQGFDGASTMSHNWSTSWKHKFSKIGHFICSKSVLAKINNKIICWLVWLNNTTIFVPCTIFKNKEDCTISHKISSKCTLHSLLQSFLEFGHIGHFNVKNCLFIFHTPKKQVVLNKISENSSTNLKQPSHTRWIHRHYTINMEIRSCLFIDK